MQDAPSHDHTDSPTGNGLDIAIVGMSGRFPGAPDLAAYWRNLITGHEAVGPLDDAWLRAQGADEALLNDPAHVRVGAPLADADRFDAAFFGFSPREAELLDPQHRVFLEVAWQALEQAGHDPARHTGQGIGLFAGAGMNGYLFNLMSDAATRASVSPYELFVANDKDFLTTRVSHKLGLNGPSVAVQTACSTSLVAVHLACQSLLAGECDMAMAGGVALSRQWGYRAEEGGIHAPDGHCRAFDAQAQGTVPGNGCGVVVLRRLDDALAEGDHILAVIKGSAINNDGSDKVSFTAPSVNRQAAVIEAALLAADVGSDTIDLVEAHGTGTRLGDPIEVAALNQAYARTRREPRTQPCLLGSVKSGIGHLDAAAGIAGLIKTVLALQHGRIPPTLHCQQPNPALDLHSEPFALAREAADWPRHEHRPRRAAVSSFGIGGTNAHVVLEEAPVRDKRTETASANSTARPLLIPVSARSAEALQQQASLLAAHFDQIAAQEATLSSDWPAAVHTLREGRQAFAYRATVQAGTAPEAAQALHALAERNDAASLPAMQAPSLVWLFPGQGSQQVAMARGLIGRHEVIDAALQDCARVLDTDLPAPLHTLLTATEAGDWLDDTAVTQPVVFALSYSLACWWRHLGVRPQALLGHSLGEWVAACVAGVFELDDALALVRLRAQAMQAMQPGRMLAVLAPVAAVQPLLDAGDSTQGPWLSAVNGPESCVLAGTSAALETTTAALEAQGLPCQWLKTSHAFHTPMMAAAAERLQASFAEHFVQRPPKAPRLPIVSSVTGRWLSAAEATSPAYWARQVLQPVRFDLALRCLDELPETLALEVGPGHTLIGLQAQHLRHAAGPAIVDSALRRAIASLPPRRDAGHAGHASHAVDSADAALQQATAQLWCAGIDIDWSALNDAAHPDRLVQRRVPLPGHPLTRQRFWIGAGTQAMAMGTAGASGTELPPSHTASDQAPMADQDPGRWVHVPTWQRSPVLGVGTPPGHIRTWLIVCGHGPVPALAAQLLKRIDAAGDNAFTLQPGDRFDEPAYRTLTLNLHDSGDWLTLRTSLAERDVRPTHLLDLRACWPRGDEPSPTPDTAGQHLHALLTLSQAWSDTEQPVQCICVTQLACEATGGELQHPEQASVHGLALVIGQEQPLLGCRVIDIDAALDDKHQAPALAARLWEDLRAEHPPALSAWRGPWRWVMSHQLLPLPSPTAAGNKTTASPLRRQAHHLIVGDLHDGLGPIWARTLAARGLRQLTLLSVAPAAPVPQALIDQCQAQGVRVVSAHIGQHDDLPATLSDAFARACEQDGPLDGVFASVPTTNRHSAAPLSLLTTAHWAYNRDTRLSLLAPLQDLVARHAPAFCCVQSSMAAVLGGVGLGAYAAANRITDAWVTRTAALTQASQGRTRWIAIDWDPTRSGHEAPADATTAPSSTAAIGAGLQAHALDDDEVLDQTERVLAAGLQGSAAVSRQVLGPRLQAWLRVQPRTSEATGPAERAAHERPALATPFVAPRNDIEQTLADIWRELLRVDRVGVDDSFFDLGGHSLLAIQVIGRVRKAFPVQLDLRDLLDGVPTIAAIASRIEPQLPRDDDLAAMQALLAEVQALSPDQVQVELARSSNPPLTPAA